MKICRNKLTLTYFGNAERILNSFRRVWFSTPYENVLKCRWLAKNCVFLPEPDADRKPFLITISCVGVCIRGKPESFVFELLCFGCSLAKVGRGIFRKGRCV